MRVPSDHSPADVEDIHRRHAAAWLLASARGIVAGRTDSAPGTASPASVRAPRPSVVLLTAYSDQRSDGWIGEGDSLADATAAAARLAARAGATTPRRLQLDILIGAPTPLPRPAAQAGEPDDAAVRRAWAGVSGWHHGLTVGHQGQAHWLLPSRLVLAGMTRRRRERRPPTPGEILALAMRQLGLPRGAWHDPSVDLWQFRTDSWIESAGMQDCLPFIQGIVPPRDTTPATLIASARAAGDYLVRAQRPDGSFRYAYDPVHPDGAEPAYNVVRHAGTAWALFDLASATGDTRYLRSASRAVDHLAVWTRADETGSRDYVLDTNGKAKLGAVGLALLALTRRLELAPVAGDRDRAFRLARQIEAMQHPDGSFESYLPVRGDEKRGSVSLYYPGEAILALTRLARATGTTEFLPAARRGADFLIAERRGLTRLPPDAWLAQALEDLYDRDRRPAYREHAIALAVSMLADQYPPSAPPGVAGAFGPLPIRAPRVSARAEGIIAAYRLARAADDGRAGIIRDGLTRLTPILLALQYDRDNSFYLGDLESAIGGVRGGLDDATIQIDFVQHHISAMLGLANL